MSHLFPHKPIINFLIAYPAEHCELGCDGQPTDLFVPSRSRAKFITPIPRQRKVVFAEGKGLSTQAQQYDRQAVLHAMRQEVDNWRVLPNRADWRIAPRPYQHWRCQCAITDDREGTPQ